MPVFIDHEFKASAEQLWEILGTPDRVDWVHKVTSCTFDGEVRSLDLPGAGAIKERILNHDSDARIPETPALRVPVHWSHTEQKWKSQPLTVAVVCNGRPRLSLRS